MNMLFESISSIKGVGDKKNSLFKKINIKKIIDLLYYKPKKIQKYLHIKTKDDFNKYKEYLKYDKNIILYVSNIRKKSQKKVHIFEGVFENNLFIEIIFFNKASSFKIKNKGYIRGSFEFKNKKLQFVHPEFFENIYSDYNNKKSIYNLPQGLFNSDINKILNIKYSYKEWIPDKIKKKYNFLDFHSSILEMHRTGNSKRLAFDEVMFLYGYILKNNNISFISKNINYRDILSRANIILTKSQENVIKEIYHDLKKQKPMTRLLHGDVGSGKTIVAMISMLGFLDKQVIILVPTTLLAEQHFNFAKKILDSNISIKMIVSGVKDYNISNINLVIGTHALIEDKVDLSNAEYIIIDEQHKFGVQQRSKLIDKSSKIIYENNNKLKKTPHLLIMSATPIPRTMEKALSGMISVSKITEMPFKKKIKSYSVSIDNFDKLVIKIKSAITAGLTGYWICPAIESNDIMESIETRYEYLQEQLGNIVGVLHGKMKQVDKNNILEDFKKGKYKLLLSTTAVETGIDISHARFIVIEHSERFGLSQLHQIRGRIGRNNDESYCFLLYYTKNPQTIDRINIIRDNLDGFTISEYDLEFRGSGEVYGNMQSGLSFNIFDFFDPINDSKMIMDAKNIDYENINNYDQLINIMKYRKSNIV